MTSNTGYEITLFQQTSTGAATIMGPTLVVGGQSPRGVSYGIMMYHLDSSSGDSGVNSVIVASVPNTKEKKPIRLMPEQTPGNIPYI